MGADREGRNLEARCPIRHVGLAQSIGAIAKLNGPCRGVRCDRGSQCYVLAKVGWVRIHPERYSRTLTNNLIHRARCIGAVVSIPVVSGGQRVSAASQRSSLKGRGTTAIQVDIR